MKMDCLFDISNHSEHDYPKERNICFFIERQVSLTPDRTAIIDQDRTMTYHEVNSSANKLARLLVSKGARPGSVIGILLERSADMIIAILAVLKTGAAYLPLHVNDPEERITHILKRAGASILITNTYRDVKEIVCIPMRSVESDADESNLCMEFPSSSLAYVIFTSGSTGEPKGVKVRQDAVVNRILWMISEYGLTENDVFFQKTSFTFDVSVWEIFTGLFIGAQLVLCKQGQESNIDYLVSMIEQHKITVCHFIPSLFSVFLKFIDQRKLTPRLSSLRYIFCSGEVLSYYSVQEFQRLLKQGNPIRLINMYGPTEATIEVTFFECTHFISDRETVPIGKPIWNNRIYIFDKALNPCSEGELGEIYIAGLGVAEGYIHDEELTRQRFIPDPFIEGSMMYKTGDYGCWRQGNVEFSGRLDNQIKIRGYRIELEEIENALIQNNHIIQAMAFAYGDAENKSIAVIYTSDRQLDSKDIREFLKRKLPEYMLPSRYIQTDSFLSNKNGKIDRKAMIEKHLQDPGNTSASFLQANSDLEQKILDTIKEALDKDWALINSDMGFSESGIGSISFVRMIVALEDAFGFEFDADMLVMTEFENLQSLINYVKRKIADEITVPAL